MSLDVSVPRARDAQEDLHDSVESLESLADALREVRRSYDISDIGECSREYDRFAEGVAEYMEKEAQNMDDRVEELIDEFSMFKGTRGNFMSPTYNFGTMEEVPQGGFMSPTYNFGNQSSGFEDVEITTGNLNESLSEDSANDSLGSSEDNRDSYGAHSVYNPQINFSPKINLSGSHEEFNFDHAC